MGRVAIRDFLDKEIALIEKVKIYADGMERIEINGKIFKVITK